MSDEYVQLKNLESTVHSRKKLSRSLMFTVLGKVAYLSANEGVHIPFPNQWESKINTNLHQRGECNIAQKANLLPSAMRACMYVLSTEASCFMHVCHSTVLSVRSNR
jgi:hypothetical protein